MPAALRTIGWGVFCACSWTWCIGMFLPVILIGRYGWAGFLVFAVPNVLGCAAFGYVVRDRARSQRMVEQHGAAMRWFSIITLAYHVFFLGFLAWALTGVEGGTALAIAGPIAILLMSIALSAIPVRAWLPFAAIVYGLSLVTFWQFGVRPLGEIAMTAGEMFEPRGGLIWLAPAIAVGFLLCPYLDLTFHRALRQSPSRHAFAIFGVTFAVMIVLTAAYRDVLEVGLSRLVLAHIVAQSVFTMAAHQRELRAETSKRPNVQTSKESVPLRGNIACAARRQFGRLNVWTFRRFVPLLALPLAFIAWIGSNPVEGSIDMYLRFLLFYGLVFPAYIVLFVSPRMALGSWRKGAGKFWLAVLLAAPLYEASFVHGWTWLAILPPAALGFWLVARRNAPAGGSVGTRA